MLTNAQKRILHHCPDCGHLYDSHEIGGCIAYHESKTKPTCPCTTTPAWISTTYDAVDQMLVEELGPATPTVDTKRVLQDFACERDRQAALGWTPGHDDQHLTHTLVSLAERYAHKPGSELDRHRGFYSRRRLVQATALLVAAIESIDRREASHA